MDIDIRNACLSWQGTPVFEGLDLTLKRGQWNCILGASGVGKSSFVQLLAGIAHEASVTADIRCSDGQPLEGRVSWMAQQDMLLPWLSVLDNVLLGPRLRGGKRSISADDKARAKSLLHQAGLEGFESRYPAQLSGGQRQRVALVRTLLEDKPLVCMDEPFSALDAVNKLKLQDLAAKMLAGSSVLMITHDPLEALRLGDRVLVMQGSPATLREIELPASEPPRCVQDPEVLLTQGRILQELSQAEGVA